VSGGVAYLIQEEDSIGVLGLGKICENGEWVSAFLREYISVN
jgi:hypothetical protein